MLDYVVLFSGGGANRGTQLPTILLSASTVAENVGIGGFQADITTANTPGDWGTSTYTIESGGDPDSKFDIDGTALENDATFDFETAESHQVTITDTPSGPYDPISRQFTISVTDVEESERDFIEHMDTASTDGSSVGGTYSAFMTGL